MKRGKKKHVENVQGKSGTIKNILLMLFHKFALLPHLQFPLLLRAALCKMQLKALHKFNKTVIFRILLISKGRAVRLPG